MTIKQSKKSRRHPKVKRCLHSLNENIPSSKAGEKLKNLMQLFSFLNMKGKLDKTVKIDCKIAQLTVWHI